MHYWIFVVTNQKTDNGTLNARKIYEQRMADQFWGLGETTPNRRTLAAGDQVVFYLGIPERVFAGTATVVDENFKLTAEQQNHYAHANRFYEWGIFWPSLNPNKR